MLDETFSLVDIDLTEDIMCGLASSFQRVYLTRNNVSFCFYLSSEDHVKEFYESFPLHFLQEKKGKVIEVYWLAEDRGFFEREKNRNADWVHQQGFQAFIKSGKYFLCRPLSLNEIGFTAFLKWLESRESRSYLSL